MTEITVYTYAVPIIIALILGEAIYSNIKGLNFYKTNDTLGSYGLLAGNVVVSLLTKGSFLLFNIYLYQFRLFTINDLMHVFFVVVLTFAAIDFIYYWFHRCSHRIKFLWATHNITQAKRFADDIIFIADGKVSEISEAKKFFNNPSSTKANNYIKGL